MTLCRLYTNDIPIDEIASIEHYMCTHNIQYMHVIIIINNTNTNNNHSLYNKEQSPREQHTENYSTWQITIVGD